MENPKSGVEQITPLSHEDRVGITVMASLIDAEGSEFARGHIDHPCYQELLGMGEDGLRVILEELAADGALERRGFKPGWRHKLVEAFVQQTGQAVVLIKGTGDELTDLNESILTWARQNDLLDNIPSELPIPEDESSPEPTGFEDFASGKPSASQAEAIDQMIEGAGLLGSQEDKPRKRLNRSRRKKDGPGPMIPPEE